MTLSFRPASRASTIPLIGLYGQSGCGKTHSALMLARGFVGPSGRIGMIDTEGGRGEIFSDVLPGGYDVLPLGPPFSAQRYIEAVNAAKGMDVVIVDSVSHEWEGVGGVLDQASEIEKRTNKAGLHCWNKPKMEHQRFVLTLLQASVPVICCLRAKFKSRQGKNPRTGKTEIIKDDHTTPIQDEAFIYEMTIHAEILQDHKLRVTKLSHPDLRDVFKTGDMISIQTGEALRAWSDSGKKIPREKAAGNDGPSVAPEPAAAFDNSNLTEAQKGVVKVAKMGFAKFRDTWQSYDEAEKKDLGGKAFFDFVKDIAKRSDLGEKFDASGNAQTTLAAG